MYRTSKTSRLIPTHRDSTIELLPKMYRTSKTSRLIPTHRDSTIELLPKISRQIQRANHFIGEKAGVKLAIDRDFVWPCGSFLQARRGCNTQSGYESSSPVCAFVQLGKTLLNQHRVVAGGSLGGNSVLLTRFLRPVDRGQCAGIADSQWYAIRVKRNAFLENR